MTVTNPIFVAIRPSVYQTVFDAEQDRLLRAFGAVTFQASDAPLTSAQLATHLIGCEIVVTGWGTPTFTDEVLAAAGNLKLITHSAGSIKTMLPPTVFERGIAVSHAANAIAPAVAEMTILLILLSLRQAHTLDRQLKSGGDWAIAKTLGLGRELAGSRVGVVGAGYTGRCVIKLLTALDAEVWVYDPYLNDKQAAALGVRRTALDELLASCPTVTLQAPPTKETYRMIGRHELGLLQDGAIFINTARSHLVDEEALLAELRSGRIQAALDVFDQEPLPPDHPFRRLENVILTPHVAGASQQARLRQGQTVVEEIKRFLASEPLRYQVTGAMLDTMA